FFHDKELNLNLFMLVHGEQAFEFCDVVRAGDVITSRGEIIHIENKETLDVVTLLGESVNQAGTMVCKAVFTFVIRK
ncbi:MAG TPA: MaoC family dehydratase N-terminal domain-containing protein, partial [Syntrophales bacterium]|nr:MaoC family dehydratase N-terminal domain-containing protein [Syntrophales bacterium]